VCNNVADTGLNMSMPRMGYYQFHTIYEKAKKWSIKTIVRNASYWHLNQRKTIQSVDEAGMHPIASRMTLHTQTQNNFILFYNIKYISNTPLMLFTSFYVNGTTEAVRNIKHHTKQETSPLLSLWQTKPRLTLCI